jgi:hypothetical protein
MLLIRPAFWSALSRVSPGVGALRSQLVPEFGGSNRHQALSDLHAAHDKMGVGIAGRASGVLPTRQAAASIASSWR